LNLSKVTDFRMGGFGSPDFVRGGMRDAPLGRDVHNVDERRFHDDDDIVSDDDLVSKI